MAVLKSKQLPTRLSGSYVLSGSSQTLHGTTTIHGTTTVSGSLTLKGTSVDLNIRQDDNTNIARLLTSTGGEGSLKLFDNANHGSVIETININTSDQEALIIKSGSSTVFTVDRDNTLISGSSTSTGSFGHLSIQGNVTASGIVRADAFESATGGDTISFGDNLSVTGQITASGNINTTSGRVFEQGTSVIDHATAMAIVFGG
jgi:hypothetical protein